MHILRKIFNLIINFKMKRNLFLLFACFATIASAQFTVETHDGDPIVDGQTVAYGVYGYGPAELPFYVYNQSTTDQIFMKIEFVSAVNNDGSDVELCFGLCYTGLTIGWSYPPGSDTVIIEPGEHQPSEGDHIVNLGDGGGNIIDYVFRFYQVDEVGNEIGDDLTMTYRYDPNLGLNDHSRVNAQLLATNVKDQLVVVALEDTHIEIFDIQGRRVLDQKLISGTNQVNMSNLPTQMYIVKLTNKQGASQITKIVKR